ncbi:MAG: DUF1788 domain-containing protein [Candidatus Binatia bacterium]|nr:DUF1788 domain-containing protein [Candidatus Binatia bacterium]
MNPQLRHRWDQILPRITAPDFLAGRGIGNEIACYVFDYPADDELAIRESLGLLRQRLDREHADLKVVHLDLLDQILAYLKSRNFLDRAIESQKKKDDAQLVRALEGPLAAERVAEFIGKQYPLKDSDLILLSGVGSMWPMLRAHALLNCLHPLIGTTPLVMFYPGSFDGTSLSLFDKISNSTTQVREKPYYRAFSLVPQESNL